MKLVGCEAVLAFGRRDMEQGSRELASACIRTRAARMYSRECSHLDAACNIITPKNRQPPAWL
jgi:hypothetical protein